MSEFQPFPKMARLTRNVVITEKIDGTNAQVWISDDLNTMLVGSRTRWITPQSDNHGFARWAEANRDELLRLGPGRHFGEWWGSGIQRRYGLAEKRFSLFNVHQWTAPDATLPACCHLVPVLYEGLFNADAVDIALDWLSRNGSAAAPGFADPEGIVVFHQAAGVGFKKTLKGDSQPKSAMEGVTL